ncbi:MAG TPA: response regulator [Polyangiaceae bacterium]|nr:response regulator [Polyangiaceae bacterium]
MKDPLKYFRVEARDILEQLQSGLLELERGPRAPELVQKLLRLGHTLKGAARVVKQTSVADLAHRLEDLLLPLKGQQDELPAERVSQLLAIVDSIAQNVAALEPAPAPAPEAPVADAAPTTAGKHSAAAAPVAAAKVAEARPPSGSRAQLEPLVGSVNELGYQLGGIRQATPELNRAQLLAEELSRRLEPQRTREWGAAAAPLRALSSELEARLGKLERHLITNLARATRELGQLRDRVDQLRLVSAGSIFGVLERAARDAAVSLGKSTSFETQGGDVRLDAEVLSAVERALVQAVRNAVAHGIEPSKERAAAGKPAQGRISLRVERVGKVVSFVCRDDGRGVDVAEVRRSAERQGRLPPGSAQVPREQVLELLLQGGISTAREVSQVAGRGVGLDLIREALAGIGGTVRLDTEPGSGTELRLEVPVSLSALEGLLVEAGGAEQVLPLSCVARALRIGAAELSYTAAGASLSFEGRSVPFVPLSAVLRRDSTSADDRQLWSTVLIKTSGGPLALGVDRLLGVDSIVARALPESAVVAPSVVGVTLDVDGNPRLLLDPDALLAAAAELGGRAVRPQRQKRLVLVVDDSLTTRMLEQSILESAGYEVELATSGEEGLRRALARPHDLFLVDVEMPGMDGFTFVEKVRADARLASTPAVLVTSRATPEDLARGKTAGASDHIAKGEFDQQDFLDRIERLMR